MISFLMGEIRNVRLDPCTLVIVSAGVGYEVTLPVFVYESLNIDGLKPGKHIELEIYYHVTERQPKPVLVGFRHPTERNFFEQLIEVEGIGPTKAASALVFPVSTIAAAIEMIGLGSIPFFIMMIIDIDILINKFPNFFANDYLINLERNYITIFGGIILILIFLIKNIYLSIFSSYG